MKTEPDASITPIDHTKTRGLTKREHFALEILKANLVDRTPGIHFKMYVVSAVEIADMLIDALNVQQQNKTP